MDDISTGAKIGIGLVILCFLVMITLSLLMIVKNITNSGTTTLQSGLDQMLQTQFDDYDQMVKTGTEVSSAVKLFSGQAVGIVVVTGACEKSSTFSGYNYGALLDGFTEKQYQGDATNKVFTGTAKWTKDGTVSYYTRNLQGAGGGVTYNLNTKPTGMTGTEAFVRSSAKFLAELIKDETGTTVGIIFTQQT